MNDNREINRIKQILSNSFSKVYKLDISSVKSYYLKFFKYPHKYVINNVDLSSVFKRDRLKVSQYFYLLFRKNKRLQKYLNYYLWVLSEENLMITKDKNGNNCNFSDVLLNKVSFSDWTKQIRELSGDLINNQIKVINHKNIFNNKQVLKMKFKLQFINPLLKVLSQKKVSEIVNRVGSLTFLNHGDLQPKNILISKDRITIIDFEEAFIGPQGWDVGFLWGNIIYLTIENRKNFNAANSFWNKTIKNVIGENLRFNVVIFTVSAILMRIYFFPLMRVSDNNKKILLTFIQKMLKIYDYEA